MSNAFRTEEPHLPHAHDELMTMKEVAALVRVPEATLRYWRHLSKGLAASASGARFATDAPRSRSGSKSSPAIPRTRSERTNPSAARRTLEAGVSERSL